MKNLFCIFAIILLSGCGVTTSEVVPAGKDTFMIVGHGYATKAPEAMLELYKEANKYCSAFEKHFVPVSTSSEPFDQLSSSVQMHFRCLREGDPELNRPMLEPSPGTLVEIKKQ